MAWPFDEDWRNSVGVTDVYLESRVAQDLQRGRSVSIVCVRSFVCLFVRY